MPRITSPTPEERDAAQRRLTAVWAPELARRSDRDRLDAQADTTAPADRRGGAR
ncbi:hypothetical protein [Streptomyces sp. NPDC049879]|uniref:hypothetical protein n=1 Tax=Streptomyces sp. NPDC049879 TaxID=3365598 RepID=UPI00379F61C2